MSIFTVNVVFKETERLFSSTEIESTDVGTVFADALNINEQNIANGLAPILPSNEETSIYTVIVLIEDENGVIVN